MIESPSPDLAEPWGREVHQLLTRMFRARFILVPALALLFCVFFFLDPEPWKLVWIGTIIVVVTAGIAFEYWRIRKSAPSEGTVQANLAAMLVLQTAMIYITGGIESPLLALYVAFGFISGLSLAKRRRVVPIIAIPVFFSTLLGAGALYGWFPRATPGFLGLGDGFYDRPVYVWVRVATVILLVNISSLVGSAIRRTLDRITRQVVQARREALDALASRNRDILSIAGTVAHELKNPLTSIQGLAQLLARGAAPGTKDSERLEVMRREISRMTNVLDEFRSFARPLTGLALRYAHMRELIGEVVALNEGQAEARGVEIALKADGDLEVMCDRQKVKQALINLVQNSLEATPAGGRVVMELVVHGQAVHIRVLDTGPGVAAEIRPRLFVAGATTKEHGSGIGLVVARSIAEQHGGRVTLEDGPTGGGLATLMLPLRPPVGAQEEP